MQTFRVELPSGVCYWTVLDDRWEPVAAADRFLRHVRFGKDQAESTTRAYAGSIALFLRWCGATGRDWRTAAAELASFMVWLRYSPGGDRSAVVRPGPGATPVRGPRRVNAVLAAVRAFVLFAVSDGEVGEQAAEQLYALADARDLPVAATGEGSRLRARLGARHRLRESQEPVGRLSDSDLVAMVSVARSARDRLIMLLMARAGLRRGEVAGLRRGDMHLLLDNASLGCRTAGAHLHVVPRQNSNGAAAKSRHCRAVPLDRLVVQALDLYAAEREACRPAQRSDFLLVNLVREPLGAAMQVGGINELVTRLGRHAGVAGRATPHMARHAFASNVLDAGGTIDEVQQLLGHALASSTTGLYLHPDPDRLRAAIDRVGVPRDLEWAGRTAPEHDNPPLEGRDSQ